MNTQILHQISCLLFLLFFLLCALHDGRTKTIPAGLCRIFFGIGVPLWLLRLFAALQGAASPLSSVSCCFPSCRGFFCCFSIG